MRSSMRRISFVKSQEELKTDIFCLKKKLSVILDENQLLKVKIRKLDNELRRKDKYIERYKFDFQKNREVRKYDDGTSIILKLQKRNEELEDMLLARDLQNEKRYNDIKTMCIYSHLDCKQINWRGSKTSLSSVTQLNSGQRSIVAHLNSGQRSSVTQLNSGQRSSVTQLNSGQRSSVTRLNSGQRSNPSSQCSLNKISSSSRCHTKRPDRMRSSNSLGDRPISRQHVESIESSRVIKSLQMERLVDKRSIRSKNAEISRLSAELREIRDNLRKQESRKIEKSTSTTHLHRRKSSNQDTKYTRGNYIEENKKNICTKRPHRKSDKKNVQVTEETVRKSDSSKLPTVHEYNEEINSPNISYKISKNTDKRGTEREVTRPKTRIEYVYDSEVSSDGEEYCLPNTLRTFLQRAVKTKSRSKEDEETLN